MERPPIDASEEEESVQDENKSAVTKDKDHKEVGELWSRQSSSSKVVTRSQDEREDSKGSGRISPTTRPHKSSLDYFGGSEKGLRKAAPRQLPNFRGLGTSTHLGNSTVAKICKVTPTISTKLKTEQELVGDLGRITVPNEGIFEITKTSGSPLEKLTSTTSTTSTTVVHTVVSQSDIGRLRENLVKIDLATTEAYEQKLPVFHFQVLKVTKTECNRELQKEEKQQTSSSTDSTPEAYSGSTSKCGKPKWSKEVLEVEKRWSGEFLDNQLDRNSSESSKSSYVEEAGSVSSHDSGSGSNLQERISQSQSHTDACRDDSRDCQNTLTTIDSSSWFDDRIKGVDDIREESNDEDEKTIEGSSLKGSSLTGREEVEGSISSCFDQPEHELKESASNHITDNSCEFLKDTGDETSINDGYAELIKEIIMEPCSSSHKEEKKKKSGLRRLLPGLFSPKDSRKDHRKDHKERKKRDERHFSQHQQNGIYTRCPDTMNLNDDIKHNVNLDTSLNGSIIEERLNEIKQELFPNPGITTSTPDHFLQERSLHQDHRTPRLYAANSSISSIGPEDGWIDQNIISGSPDMRKLKQKIRNDDRKCNLERKHSLQESAAGFFRNHGPSGRISAPPSERYLIRPRAVHPIDRPLPAIPQKIEFSNYQNHEEILKHGAYRQQAVMNYHGEGYYSGHQNYANQTELYENGNHIEGIEMNRNQSIDSGFNLTPVSTQVKLNRQFVMSQNTEKIAVNVVRSSKYSPNSSQKSGDYADSSYTPNSSQKSEFSPGSSKSGEYYLNSPRSSCQMSPDTSFSRDQSGHEKTLMADDVSSSMGISTADHLYDEAPRSLSVSPRTTQLSTAQEVTCMRSSPNIPLSTNLAKLRANVEEATESGSKEQTSRLPSPVSSSCSIPPSPMQSPGQRDKSLSVSSSVASVERRVTSPLTISTLDNQKLETSDNQSRSGTPLISGIIPSPRGLIQTKSPERKRITSPTISQLKASTPTPPVTSRKANPNDQILIASPKRDPMYDQRSPSKMDPRFRGSPVIMADSPNRSLSPRQKSPQVTDPIDESRLVNLREISHQPPQAFRDEPQRSLSPAIRQTSPGKGLRKPEPIYAGRASSQRTICPSPGQPKAPEGPMDALLIRTVPANFSHQPSKIPTKEAPDQRGRTSAPNSPEKSNPQQIIPPVQRSPSAPPGNVESLHLRKKNHSPSPHERPYAVYDDNSSSTEMISRKSQSPSILTVRVRSPGPQNIEKKSMQPVYASGQEIANQEQIYDKREVNREKIYAQRNEKQQAIYSQKVSEPIYDQQSNKQLSPSKYQTLQHLEAFYWQQKALETQRTSTNSPTIPKQDLKAEKSEVREAIYWQQLKKLNDEQQQKIYERSQFEEGKAITKDNPKGSASRAQRIDQRQEHLEQVYWQTKVQRKQQLTSKPPIVGQKGQHQPVLVVRPQQALRDPNELVNQRSKSVSPHFVRGDERRSLQLPRKTTDRSDDGGFGEYRVDRSPKLVTPPIYDEADDRKNPPPIFKRGSLISNSNSSVDYGTMGTKRVSFSNQSNSPEIGSGNWPTKHGMAPEPPTRRHRAEDRTSDTTDLAFARVQEENQNNVNKSVNDIYGNFPEQIEGVSETEFDAKPLPPTPVSAMTNAANSMRDRRQQRMEAQRAQVLENPRRWVRASESESGSETGEVQRILQRRNGGSGRAEGEGSSNDLPGGRRSGVIGVLSNVGVARATGPLGGGGGRSRDEPRRHTLSGDHAPSLHHQQFNTQQLHPLHPHHLPPPHGQYGTPPRHGTMDLEMGTKSRQRKSPLPRGYPPPSTAMLFDDDPGIMSEVETSSTGFRRGGKQRSSLPVVRTPSKTLERPLGDSLGLVFLQYRKETKRALLPNEITSIDTVKALFVRSFPKQLTMEYLDSPDVKVYIHDSNKDMFYELEDHRSHLRDIRDRSVLRLIEKSDIVGMPGPLQGLPVGGQGLPPHWEDQSYFSEPEFDSEFQHQHIHKSKTAKNSTSGNYYMGGSSTLPRGGPIMRAYSPAAPAVLAGPNATPAQPKTLGTPGGGVAPAKPLRGYQCGKTPLGSLGGSARFSRDSSVSLYSIPDRLHGESGYMSSPERSGGVGAGISRYPGYSTQSSYEEPYYSQYSGTVTPVIDEEASDTELLEESYSLYGVKPPGRPPSGPPRSPFPPGAPALPGQTYDVTRIRVEHMERQLANLTGLVQKALTHAPHTSPSPRDYLQVPAGRDPYTRSAGAGDEFDKHSSSSSASLPDDSYLRTDVKPPKLGKDKSVSFEKSVSFSDEPPDMNSPKQHSPQHAADTKPTKPAIKSSTLPRMSSQERDRHKPNLPPKPVALAAGGYVYRDLALTPEMYNQLRGLQKKAKDLRQEVRNLRRMSQAQAHTVRETIRDTFITIRAMLLSGGDAAWAAGDSEKIRLSREEDLYKQEMIRLEKDLTELESTVEELRGNVINRKTRVNMSDVENMALILSKSSKTVADLKVRFPSLQEGMKGLLSSEMEKVVREEKFLKEEPERLESALRRCKKLTGTLVTLKRLASVQEQRLPNAVSLDAEETPPITPTSAQHSKTTAPVPAERTVLGSAGVIGGGSHPGESSAPHQQRPENALDALLDELQTFSRPSSQLSQVSTTSNTTNHIPNLLEIGRSASQIVQSSIRPPNISEIGRKGSVDSSASLAIIPANTTLRRLHSYPSSSDTDTSPPIARLQVSDGTGAPQKPPVPERNAELLQLATARRVPPPPPPRTSSRSPLASPTSPQLPPRNPTGTLRRGRPNAKDSGKPPMALPPGAAPGAPEEAGQNQPQNNILSTSNSSSCESINSQEGMQNKKGRQEQLEQRHQELLRKQKALQEQYARLQQLQRNTSGLVTVPPTPPDLLKKTGSESNLLAKMGLSMSAANSGSLTSLTTPKNDKETTVNDNQGQTTAVGNQTTTSKIYETDIL
ncbi:uncharacterized protein LOC135168377 isoform X4 [Diachasmimorpha longicaudata]|uniref:uncharacterized protein LOC135168377 isoform X4 n=1 Tax=Diachasmimorpha longicaudata TaxID=58733 RepID=UPI0030B8F42D